MFTVQTEDLFVSRGSYSPEAASYGPLITTIVTVFNYSRFVREALDDLRDQTFSPIELIVVDDCSTDDSAELVREWMDANSDRFQLCRLVRHCTNQGLAQARNTAFLLAAGKYVFVLDADNRIYPRAIARLTEAAERSGKAGAYSQLEVFGEERSIGYADVWDREHFKQENYVDAMSLIAKSAWQEVGGYSYMDVVGWEDFDFWCKLEEAGLRCTYVPEILCRYRIHGKSMVRSETNPRHERLRQEMLIRHPWLLLP
jgi:glycosyltransferase involved in cell wall biosynthesis